MSLLNFKLTVKFSIIASLQFGVVQLSYGQQSCQSPPEAANSFARTEPFSVLYSKGRTYRTAYEKDPNTLGNSQPQKDFPNVCWKFKAFDFSTKGVGTELSKKYLLDPRFEDFQVITLVSIPLQRIFVIDRNTFNKSSSQDGLVYAWKTSTGYHDKHYSYSRKAEKFVFGQKNSVQITHKNGPDALAFLKKLGQKKGAKYIETEGKPAVIFENSAKRIDYSITTSKMKKEKAIESGLEIIGEDSNLPGYLVVRKHSLNYQDYFHTEPGFYNVQNGFSSRHLSGESDGNYEIEAPTMAWALFFNIQRGMATHGAAYRGSMGSPNSHGCVRLLEENARNLFHLVGRTGQGQVSQINEKSGVLTGKKIDAYRSLFVVSDQMSDIEQKYFNQFFQSSF